MNERHVVGNGLLKYPIRPRNSLHEKMEQIRCHSTDLDRHGLDHDPAGIGPG